MKKIAIITEADNATTNYGNVLQSYALNKYLNDQRDFIAETLLVNSIIKKRITSVDFKILTSKIKFKLFKKNQCKTNFDLSDRRKSFENIFNKILTRKVESWNELLNLKYDCFVVGSDIVWIQSRGMINRVKFLDFPACKKVAYAASFGEDYIPRENIKYLKKCLNNFKQISVRESSSVEMLEKIGINSKYVCDPTLLLNRKCWSEIEVNCGINDKYIFVYLLGKNQKQRNEITKIAKKENLKIVTVPHANGSYNMVDETFGDFKIDACSPENWISLIHNAEYVFTDSFHGTVFSIIFEKKFLVLKRENELDINNRMLNFLDYIEQNNKYVDLDSTISLSENKWNYSLINEKTQRLIKESKKFIRDFI